MVTSDGKRKQHSFRYHLKRNGRRIQVCKNIFCTLGLGETTVYAWMDTVIPSGIPVETAQQAKGKRSDREKVMSDFVEVFLESLSKLPSHYCRATTSKLYMEPVFTSISQLYKVYGDKCTTESIEAVSLSLFYTIFNEMNFVTLYSEERPM